MAFYRKNMGGAQQIARVALGVGAAIAAYMLLTGPLALIGAAAGLGFAATGFVGYCPMCAIAGVGRGD